ncbi:YHYH protein [Brumimicrobium mesophilum]|uniref:YHYH protein n=1 Tax=Brumimicrobium mesophilum TaxID=392717 RepID=UPI00131CA671
MYAIYRAEHSPLIGFAYDCFPIYGAFAFGNTEGKGPILRMKSSYDLNRPSSRVIGRPNNSTYVEGYIKKIINTFLIIKLIIWTNTRVAFLAHQNI